MGINVVGEKQKLWRQDHDGKNGTWYTYNTSIPRKDNEADKWDNAYIKVRFAKRAEAPQKIHNGSTCDFEGFMTVDTYTNKDGKRVSQPMIMIMKLNIHDEEEDVTEGVDSFEMAAEDIPF